MSRDEEASQKAAQLATQYVGDLQQLPADKLAAKKDEVKASARYLQVPGEIQRDSRGLRG